MQPPTNTNQTLSRRAEAARLLTFLERDAGLAILTVLGGVLFIAPNLVSYFQSHTLRIAGAVEWAGHDFFTYWTAARLYLTGQIADLYDTAAFTAHQLSIVNPEGDFYFPWPYPPHALMIFIPLGMLAYAVAYPVWMGASFLIYGWLGRAGQGRPVDYLLLLASPAAAITLVSGQNGFLTAGLFMGGLLLVDRRPIMAGILFGLLTIKPQLGLLIPVALIAAGLWRPFIAAAATGIALAAMAAWVLGPERWLEYLAFIPSFQTQLLDRPDYLIALAPTVFNSAKIAGMSVPAAYGLQILCTLAVVAVVFWMYRRGPNRPMQAAATAVGAILATPYAYHYDMTVVVLAVITVAREGMKTGFLAGERILLIIGWFLPVALIGLNILRFPVTPVLLLILFGMMARRALGAAARPEPAEPAAGLKTAA